MASALYAVYTVLVLLVAVGGVAAVTVLTRDGEASGDLSSALIAVAVALFVVALSANMLL